MFLYTENAQNILGLLSDSQMQTYLAETLSWTNQAMVNSEIDLELPLVHVGPVSYYPTQERRSRESWTIP